VERREIKINMSQFADTIFVIRVTNKKIVTLEYFEVLPARFGT